MRQHPALARGQPARKEEARAECGLDLILFRQRVESIRPSEHLTRVDPALAREGACVLLAEEGLGAEPDALVGHQIGGGLVHEMAKRSAGTARQVGERSKSPCPPVVVIIAPHG